MTSRTPDTMTLCVPHVLRRKATLSRGQGDALSRKATLCGGKATLWTGKATVLGILPLNPVNPVNTPALKLSDSAVKREWV